VYNEVTEVPMERGVGAVIVVLTVAVHEWKSRNVTV
jgi:hypothetical protein